jgi:hypothetical protein
VAIPTERPPLVGEVSADISGERVSRGQRNKLPQPLISIFYTRSSYFSIQVAPQLQPRGCVELVPDPLLLRKSGSAGNRTRDLYICSQELWSLDHRGGQSPLNSPKLSSQITSPQIFRSDNVMAPVLYNYQTFSFVIESTQIEAEADQSL